MAESRRLILGISGASGARLGLRALSLLAASVDLDELHVVVSPRALVVARPEGVHHGGVSSLEGLAGHFLLPVLESGVLGDRFLRGLRQVLEGDGGGGR